MFSDPQYFRRSAATGDERPFADESVDESIKMTSMDNFTGMELALRATGVTSGVKIFSSNIVPKVSRLGNTTKRDVVAV